MVSDAVLVAKGGVTDDLFWKLNWARGSIQLIVFALNTYTICFFYQMVSFFLKSIGIEKQMAKRYRMLVYLIMSIIIIVNTRDNTEMLPLLINYAVNFSEDKYQYWRFMLIYLKICIPFDFFVAILPVTIASFITLNITYFAKG